VLTNAAPDRPSGSLSSKKGLGARRDREPVGRTDEVAAPLVAVRAEGGANLDLVAVGFDEECLTDVLRAHENKPTDDRRRPVFRLRELSPVVVLIVKRFILSRTHRVVIEVDRLIIGLGASGLCAERLAEGDQGCHELECFVD
jgi:hypothetical protein